MKSRGSCIRGSQGAWGELEEKGFRGGRRYIVSQEEKKNLNQTKPNQQTKQPFLLPTSKRMGHTNGIRVLPKNIWSEMGLCLNYECSHTVVYEGGLTAELFCAARLKSQNNKSVEVMGLL